MNGNQIWAIFLLAIAISIDGFAVGVTYGLRKIKISIIPLIIIGLISASAILLTSFLGSSLANIMNPEFAEKIGGIILICLGIWLIYSAIKSLHNNADKDIIQKNINNKCNQDGIIKNKNIEDKEVEDKEVEDKDIVDKDIVDKDINKEILLSFKIQSFGVIINILKTPTKADFDKSGTINKYEALFLGLALAIDALGAGLGAGMTGFASFHTPLIIGFMTASFVGSGFVIGGKAGDVLPDYIRILPGFIIIIFGVLNFF